MTDRRALYLVIAGVILFLVVIAGLFLSLNGGGVSLSLPQVSLPPLAEATLAGFFAGAVAALAVHALWPRKRLRQLHDRIVALEGQVKPIINGPPPEAPPQGTEPQVNRDRPRPLPAEPEFAPVQGFVSPAPLRRQPEHDQPRQRAGTPRIEEAVNAYNRLVAGTSLSRSSFEEFFSRLGSRGGGATASRFLTAVEAGEILMIFPSYEFASNIETQFNTIASIPDDVSEYFDTQRGDGSIVVDYPALVSLSPERGSEIRKGVIRGFRG
jgi:hypothetical protein